MSFVTSALAWLGLADAPAPQGSTSTTPAVPPRRSMVLTSGAALSLTAFYRAIQIHATAMCQLSFVVERGGLTLPDTPALIARPDLEETRSAFLEYTTVSLYIDGNAYWLKTRAGAGASTPGAVVNLTALDPREVGVFEHFDARTRVTEVRYNYRGKEYTKRDIEHLKYLRVPGMLKGLGPVQAARLTFEGALEVHEYGARWLRDAQQPDGVLTTEQELGPGDAEKYKNVWYGRNADGGDKDDASRRAHERLRVLGKGLKYEPLVLKPEDVQFLETQKFNTLEIARLTGAPASLLLTAVEGGSQTYQNVEQEWIGYVRFTLMKVIREVEEAFTSLLPRGQKARGVVETLLRSDTKTRYESHGMALDGGWMTDDEVRAIEGKAPLTDAQRAQIAEQRKSRPATTPTKEATK